MVNRIMIETNQEVIQDKMEHTLEVSHKMIKETKEENLNLDEAEVKETRDNFREDKKVKIDLDLEIGEKENMKTVLDVNARTL